MGETMKTGKPDGGLRFYDITVTALADIAGDGFKPSRGDPMAGRVGTTPARLACCPDCVSSPTIPTYFIVYAIRVGDTNHMHMQCSECGTTFCDGACG
jgi:hypothetical protein